MCKSVKIDFGIILNTFLIVLRVIIQVFFYFFFVIVMIKGFEEKN